MNIVTKSPVSYKQFLTIIQNHYGDNVQDFYTEYVRIWHTVSLCDTRKSKNEISERHKDCVEEITTKSLIPDWTDITNYSGWSKSYVFYSS
jgi:hypothetical protein